MNEARAVSTDLGQWVETKNLPPDEVASKIREIKESVLRESQYLDTENFSDIGPDDLHRLFDQYDHLFFENSCRQLLGDDQLGFRLSRRMTRSGGKTSRREIRDFIGKVVNKEYEVAVSETLLFQAFEGNHRPVVICGMMVFRSTSVAPRYEIHGIGDTNRALTEISGLQLVIEKSCET